MVRIAHGRSCGSVWQFAHISMDQETETGDDIGLDYKTLKPGPLQRSVSYRLAPIPKVSSNCKIRANNWRLGV